jgi:hypothetical protein
MGDFIYRTAARLGSCKKKRKIFEIRSWERVPEIIGPVVQWIEYSSADRQRSFLNFRSKFPACRQAGILA